MADFVTYIIIIFLVALSGLFSGLTLGLMGISKSQLKRKIQLGHQGAKKLYAIRKTGNLLHVTLLLGNTLVNAILAIFLGSITVGVLAVVISTSLIVLFGEIIPQAFFSRYALKYAPRIVWIVWIFLIILYPISKLIAILLDNMLGKELPTIFSRKELVLFIKEQRKNKKGKIKKQEYRLIEEALKLPQRQVRRVMTPRPKVFFLSKNKFLTKNLLKKISQKGFTRIPVYFKTRDNVVGTLYAKDLISINPNDKIPIRKVMRKKVFYVKENDSLEKVLNLAQEKRVHLFVVKDRFGGISGIITLEDVLEEMVGEIIDEYDLLENIKSEALK